MSKTYVVTGGAGFIGSHIAERLLKDAGQFGRLGIPEKRIDLLLADRVLLAKMAQQHSIPHHHRRCRLFVCSNFWKGVVT